MFNQAQLYTVSFYGRSVTGTEIIQLFRWSLTLPLISHLLLNGKGLPNTFTTSSTATFENVLFTKRPGSTNQFYIWGVQAEEGSTATDYIPTGSTISGAPRFDHDPLTGESLGLLIEESRTNEIAIDIGLTSNVTGTSLSEDNLVSKPDGTTGALKITATAGTSVHAAQKERQD